MEKFFWISAVVRESKGLPFTIPALLIKIVGVPSWWERLTVSWNAHH